MGRRDRARPDYVGALTGFCSARRRPRGLGTDKAGTKEHSNPPSPSSPGVSPFKAPRLKRAETSSAATVLRVLRRSER